MKTFEFTARLRKYAFTIAGLVVILIAVGLFVADQTGVYQLSNGLPVWGLVLLGIICIVTDIMKRHLYVGVGAAISVAFVVGFVIGALIAEPKEWPPRSVNYGEYCLFTWEERSGMSASSSCLILRLAVPFTVGLVSGEADVALLNSKKR